MELEHACHCTYRIRYHMVFVLKYRKKLIIDKIPIEFVKKLMTEIGERYWFKFDAIGMEEDHMHIVVGAAPRYSPSRIMQIVKSIFAKEVFKEFPEIREILWGGEFWSDGGYIGTVGDQANAEIVRKYIQQQGDRREKEQYNQLKLFKF